MGSPPDPLADSPVSRLIRPTDVTGLSMVPIACLKDPHPYISTSTPLSRSQSTLPQNHILHTRSPETPPAPDHSSDRDPGDRCTLRNSERTHDRTDKTWTTSNNPHDKPDAQSPTLAHTVCSVPKCGGRGTSHHGHHSQLPIIRRGVITAPHSPLMSSPDGALSRS